MAVTTTPRAGGLALALANPQFRLYTAGGLSSLVGNWIQRIAVGWLAWELTESFAWVGAIAMADMLPVVFIAPVAGALADRVERLPVCRALQYLSMVQAALLAALSVAGLLSIWPLFLLSLAQGCINATFQPFRQSIIANMVTREELPGAIAINSAMWHGSRFVGPAVASGLIAVLGISAAFALNALTYVPFVYALHCLRLPSRTPVARSLREIPAEIAAGLRYAFGHPVIAPVLFVLFVSSSVGRATLELLPGFADQVFGRGRTGFAILVSAAGLGAMVGALWFGWQARMASLIHIVVANVLLAALGLLMLVSSTRFELGVVGLAVTGCGVLVSGIGIQTIVQSAVHEAVRGRVMGIFGWFWVGVPGLTALCMGAISDLTGPRGPVFVGGSLVLLVWVWAMRRRGSVAAAIATTIGRSTPPG